jgi:hypothetical protein
LTLFLLISCIFGEPPPPEIPSSFVDKNEREVDKYKAVISRQASGGGGYSQLFAERSRSPKILDFIDLKPDDVFGDIGVGTGALALTILENKTPFSDMHLIDTNQTVLSFLEWTLNETGLNGDKVHVVHSKPSGILIPADTLDKALLLNTPFYISFEGESSLSPSTLSCMKSIVDALKENGELIIIERHLNETEDFPVEEDPKKWCAPLIEAFQPFGLSVTELKTLKLDDRNPHCAVRMKK